MKSDIIFAQKQQQIKVKSIFRVCNNNISRKWRLVIRIRAKETITGTHNLEEILGKKRSIFWNDFFKKSRQENQSAFRRENDILNIWYLISNSTITNRTCHILPKFPFFIGRIREDRLFYDFLFFYRIEVRLISPGIKLSKTLRLWHASLRFFNAGSVINVNININNLYVHNSRAVHKGKNPRNEIVFACNMLHAQTRIYQTDVKFIAL